MANRYSPTPGDPREQLKWIRSPSGQKIFVYDGQATHPFATYQLVRNNTWRSPDGSSHQSIAKVLDNALMLRDSGVGRKT